MTAFDRAAEAAAPEAKALLPWLPNLAWLGAAAVGLGATEKLDTTSLAGGAAVLLFNTASMGAMVKHYKEDKDFIYGLDIKHLDEMRGHRH